MLLKKYWKLNNVDKVLNRIIAHEVDQRGNYSEENAASYQEGNHRHCWVSPVPPLLVERCICEFSTCLWICLGYGQTYKSIHCCSFLAFCRLIYFWLFYHKLNWFSHATFQHFLPEERAEIFN